MQIKRDIVGNMLTGMSTEFGNEKVESLVGLSDKEIEAKVTGLVKGGI